jgi:hypothetical protein
VILFAEAVLQAKRRTEPNHPSSVILPLVPAPRLKTHR